MQAAVSKKVGRCIPNHGGPKNEFGATGIPIRPINIQQAAAQYKATMHVAFHLTISQLFNETQFLTQ